MQCVVVECEGMLVGLEDYTITAFIQESWPWKNGKEVPRWGVAEIQKMSPSTTGRCK